MPRKKIDPSRPSEAKKPLTWAKDLRGELEKLRNLIDLQIADLSKHPER